MKTMTTELWQYDAEHALKLTLTVQCVFTREGQFYEVYVELARRDDQVASYKLALQASA